MKKVLFFTLFVLSFSVLSGQDIEGKSISESGDFIIIEYLGLTNVYNLGKNAVINKTVLRKEIILSMVLYEEEVSQNNKPKRKKENDKITSNMGNLKFNVIITTSENKFAWQSIGENGISNTNVSKTYRYEFDEKSNANSFINKILELSSKN